VGALNVQEMKMAGKKQRLKKQSWKMTDQIEGLENMKGWTFIHDDC